MIQPAEYGSRRKYVNVIIANEIGIACTFKKMFWCFVFVLNQTIGYENNIPSKNTKPQAKPAVLSEYPLEHIICSILATKTESSPLMAPTMKQSIRKYLFENIFAASWNQVKPEDFLFALKLGGVGG